MLGPGFYNMDCMEAMKEYPDGYFELAIVDPPYGIGADNFKNGDGDKRWGDPNYESAATKARKKNRLNQGGGKLKSRKLLNSDCSWDVAPGKEYFDELFRVSRNQIIWGGNYFPLPPTRCFVVWDKKQSWENFSQEELAWTSFDKPAKVFSYCNRIAGQGSIHPTQKPIDLYKYLLSRFAKPGDKILDTHVGSASSLIACHELGFEYTGFEINEQYYREAKERLDRELAQVTIHDLLGGGE